MTLIATRNTIEIEDHALILDIEQATSRLNVAMLHAQRRGLVVDVKLNSVPIETINTFEFYQWQVNVNVYARLSLR